MGYYRHHALACLYYAVITPPLGSPGSFVALQVAIIAGNFELAELIKKHKDSDIGEFCSASNRVPTGPEVGTWAVRSGVGMGQRSRWKTCTTNVADPLPTLLKALTFVRSGHVTRALRALIGWSFQVLWSSEMT